MSTVKVGDVVIHDSASTRRMLFYVESLSRGNGSDVSVFQVTSSRILAWGLGLPANELTVVGHIEGGIEICRGGYFNAVDMVKFEPARTEALRLGAPLMDAWTR